MRTSIILSLLLVIISNLILAQDEPRRFNEYNMQPEVWHFTDPIEGQVNEKGDLNLSIPVLSVPGANGLDFQINFSYKAGITYYQTASWIGLGWNFDPGSITRDVSGDIQINNVVYNVDNLNQQSFTYMPDVYYMMIPGKGTFTMGRNNISGFNQYGQGNYLHPYSGQNGFYLEEYKPYVIEYDTSSGKISQFTITTDDGVKYIYGLHSEARYKSYINSINISHPNAWRLLAIVAPDFGGDVADLLQKRGDPYSSLGPPNAYNSLGIYTGWIKLEYAFVQDTIFKSIPANASHYINNTYLKWIITPTHYAEFTTGSRDDIDLKNFGNYMNTPLPAYRRLTSIALKRKSGALVKKVELDQSYALAYASNDGGKLTLEEIKFKSHNNDSLPGFQFAYSDSNPRWRYDSNDHYYDGLGYYNNHRNLRSGIDDNPKDAQAWSLKKIIYPTGGWEEYQFENDSIATDSISYTRIDYSGAKQIRWFNFDNWVGPDSTCRRQGGVRVTSVNRGDGMGNTMKIIYSYGPGHIPCAPAKMFPFYDPYEMINKSEFVVHNRGEMDIVYEWVSRKYYPENNLDRDTTFYFIGPPLKTLLYQPGSMSVYWTFHTDNSTYSWGLPLKKVVIRGFSSDITGYQYSSVFKTGGVMFPPDPPFNETYTLTQYSYLTSRETTTSKAWFGANQNKFVKLVQNSYSDRTRQLTKSITKTKNKQIKTESTYAHEISDYGGSTWHPDSLQGMRKENLLTPAAKTNVYYLDYNNPLSGQGSGCSAASDTTVIVGSSCRTTCPLTSDSKTITVDFVQTIYWECNLAVIFIPGQGNGIGTASFTIKEDAVTLVSKTCVGEDGAPCFGNYSDSLVFYPGKTYTITTQVFSQAVKASSRGSVDYAILNVYFTLQKSFINTFKQIQSDDSLTWKPHKAYKLNSQDTLCSTPGFDNWLDSGAYDPAWQFQYEAEEYKYGQMTKLRDANGHLLEIFYGDNQNNLVNNNQENGFAHAYLTGLRLRDSSGTESLTKQFDYDTLFMQVNAITDENNNTRRFEFDPFGRLQKSFDANDSLIAENEYAFSRDLNGGVFSASRPNYTKTRLHYDAARLTDAYDFFDGRSRKIQSVISSSGYDYYAAREVDMVGRVFKAFKPYRKSGATQPLYDSTYAYRDENGNHTGALTGRFTETYYNSWLDEQVNKVEFPGPKLLQNLNRLQYSYVLAKTELPEIFAAGNKETWFKKKIIDENGRESFTFLDQLGNKALNREFGSGDEIVPTSSSVQLKRTLGVWSDSLQFSLEFEDTVTWVFDVYMLIPPGEAPSSGLIIHDGSATIVSESCTSSTNISGEFTASPGVVYTIKLTIDCDEHTLVRAGGYAYYERYGLMTLNTYFEYDGSGNLIKVYPPNYFAPPGGSVSSDWITAYKYNTLGQMVEKNSPDAGTVRYLYDLNGNLRFTQDANHADSAKVSFTTYDFNNRPLVFGIAKAGFDTLTGSSAYAFENDTLNRISANRYDLVPNSSAFPWNRAPGMAAYLDSLENIAGRLAANAYRTAVNEPINYLRLQNRTLSAGQTYTATDSITVGPGVTVTGAGDIILKAGRRVRLTPGVTVHNGARLQAVVDPTLLTNPVTADLWQITLYSYNVNGQVAKKFIFSEDIEMTSYAYKYNRQGQATQIASRLGNQQMHHFYVYDGLGQLVRVNTSENSVKPTLADVAYTYNPAGGVDSLKLAEVNQGVFREVIPYSYTIRDWVEEIGDVTDTSRTFSAKYSYSPNGNIQEAQFHNKLAAMEPRYKYDFSYTENYQLMAADYYYYNGSWNNAGRFDLPYVNYDPNGNILKLIRYKENDSVIDNLGYSYGSNNRLQSVNDSVAATTAEDWDAEDTQFQYDANGNVILSTESNGGTQNRILHIQYDHRNLPVSLHITDDNLDQYVYYRYNADGQRIYKKVGSQSGEHYIMDVDQNVAVINENDFLKYWNILANGLVGRIDAAGNKFFYIKDHLGSTRAVVNNNGVVVEAHDYYPFGLKMPGRDYQTAERTKELFTSKERDTETNWDYFGARYYDPAIGRWLVVDPLAEKYISMSPYNYAANNPLKYIDLDGKYLYNLAGERITAREAFGLLKSGMRARYDVDYDNNDRGFYEKREFDWFDPGWSRASSTMFGGVIEFSDEVFGDLMSVNVNVEVWGDISSIDVFQDKNNSNNNTEIWVINVFNHLGQQVAHITGTREQIEKFLKEFGRKLRSGSVDKPAEEENWKKLQDSIIIEEEEEVEKTKVYNGDTGFEAEYGSPPPR